jgi:hypothetical protein
MQGEVVAMSQHIYKGYFLGCSLKNVKTFLSESPDPGLGYTYRREEIAEKPEERSYSC